METESPFIYELPPELWRHIYDYATTPPPTKKCTDRDSIAPFAQTMINGLFLCKQINQHLMKSGQWILIYKYLTHSPMTIDHPRTALASYRAYVYCSVRQRELETRVRCIATENKLWHRTPSGKIWKMKVGMRKMARLAPRIRSTEERNKYILLTKEYTRIHKNYLSLGNRLYIIKESLLRCHRDRTRSALLW